MEYAQTTLNHLIANRDDVRQKVEVSSWRAPGAPVHPKALLLGGRTVQADPDTLEGVHCLFPVSSSGFGLDADLYLLGCLCTLPCFLQMPPRLFVQQPNLG